MHVWCWPMIYQFSLTLSECHWSTLEIRRSWWEKEGTVCSLCWRRTHILSFFVRSLLLSRFAFFVFVCRLKFRWSSGNMGHDVVTYSFRPIFQRLLRVCVWMNEWVAQRPLGNCATSVLPFLSFLVFSLTDHSFCRPWDSLHVTGHHSLR